MTSKQGRPSKPKPSQAGNSYSRQAIAALPANYKPEPLTEDESRELDARAQAVLEAIDCKEWGKFIHLCKDFHALEIMALVDLLRADSRRRLERARKLRSIPAAKNAALRWKKLEPLRTFACRKDDAKKWRSALYAASQILRSVLKERDRLGLPTPKDSNAMNWLVELLRKHRRNLPNAKH